MMPKSKMTLNFLYWLSKKRLFSRRRRAKFLRSAEKRDPDLLRMKMETAAQGIIQSLTERCFPHLTVVAMARNEELRADDMMRHLCALFDRIVLIDHLSEDDTAQIVRGYDGVAGTEVIVFRSEDSCYYQSQYMSEITNALVKERKTDWVFYLDFDEFLPFIDAASFRQALVSLSDSSVIHCHWINVALDTFDLKSLQGAKGFVGPSASDFVKVAINARRFESEKITVCQGNHAIMSDRFNEPYIGERAFCLFHVPILGPNALKRKVLQGTLALNETVDKDSREGIHWRDIHSNLDDLVSSTHLTRQLALNYGRPVEEILRMAPSDDLSSCMRPFKLDFAQIDLTRATHLQDVKVFTLETIVEVVGARIFPAPDEKSVSRVTDPVYGKLPQRSQLSVNPFSVRDRVEYALIAAATQVEVVVPTAWLGHIPFLFTLMEIVRPRRYVELGTHEGASFFAACQHIRSNNRYGEAVAVDLWQGDHQTGYYKEEVFDNFKFLLSRNFPGTGKFIRSYFSEAASCFEDGSIDLLHIDGLHTFDAVKEDYETWFPKLDKNGVIIFHDTNEFQADFGVWQFFEMIRGDAVQSFQFRHGHGLGVLAFGERSQNPAIELLEHFNTRPEIIESYYATIGTALYDSARFRMSRSHA